MQRAALDGRRLARRAVVGNRHGQRFAGQVTLERARGVEQVGVAAERELDPVGDLEPGGLARVLDGVDDLAREALADQLVVELELERHRV